jgi:hypothetical protein
MQSRQSTDHHSMREHTPLVSSDPFLINTKVITFVIISAIGLTISCQTPVITQAPQRLWLDARIDGNPVRFCFDSGSDDFILWRHTAQRLKLKFTEPSTNAVVDGKVPSGITETYSLSLLGREGKTRFRVLTDPSYVSADFDGIVGWWELKENILKIDASLGKLSFLTAVPQGIDRWIRFGVVTNSDSLELEDAATGVTNGILCIDTGSDFGIILPHRAWQAWKSTHADERTTFNSFFAPGVGLVAQEEAWANRFYLGSLELTDVPIMEALQTDLPANGSYQGTLGLTALQRVDCIIDGEHNIAYLRPKHTQPPVYNHNRLGAIFLPNDSNTKLIARVAAKSPAEEAGIYDGDELFDVDGLKVTVEDSSALGHFWRPAGTKVNLMLRRGQKVFNTTATLQDILCPRKE